MAWTLVEWEFVVRLARRLRLLARLADSLDAAGLLARVPDVARRHLVAERQVSRFRTAALVWALERIRSTLGPVGYPCVLLKGAAYEGQALPIARGRLPSDVDVLVPRANLDTFQRALVADGWKEVALDAEDQRYYRDYSHELPPMRHPLHAIELDVHHDILPPVARTRVDIERMFEQVQPSAWPGWCVLQPADQVLHSAAHLFFDSQARDRLRDLIDLDGLLRHFGGDQAAFFDELIARAIQLGL
ncbi:MAG: nucleotidyltransferase family protein, partial [Aquincola sp.]|nr:nucleotidyltransferase family protein [Aquincola sp.]